MNFAILESQQKSILSKIRDLEAEIYKLENAEITSRKLIEKNLTVGEFEFVQRNFPSLSFAEILETLKGLDTIELIVPVDVSIETASNIINNLELKIGKPVCVKFTVDESLIAGAKIAFNGRIVDYSLRKKIVEIFES